MQKESKTILLLEDNNDLVELIKSCLVAYGFDVVTGNDGVEGLEILKKLKPDLIILDVNMPKMNGMDFYTRILTDLGRPKYPVIVLTARDELEKIFKDIEVDGFMAKPFDMKELLKKIDSILSGEANYNVFFIDQTSNKHLAEIKELLRIERFNVFHCEDFDEFKKTVVTRTANLIFIEYKQSDITVEQLVVKLEAEGFNKVPIFIYSFLSLVDKKDELFLKENVKYVEHPLDYDNFLKIARESEFAKKK